MPPKPIKQMTGYVKVLLASQDILALWGLVSHLSAWILLQGYVILPSTFIATVAHLESPSAGMSLLSTVKADLLFLFRDVPQFPVACGVVFIGGFGISLCWWRWRRNYVWVLKEIVSPGLYGGLTGLVATVANLGAQKWQLSFASKVTLCVTGGATAFFAILGIIYKYFLLGSAKKKHIKETGYHVGVGQNGEGHIQANESVKGRGAKAGNVLSWVSNGV